MSASTNVAEWHQVAKATKDQRHALHRLGVPPDVVARLDTTEANVWINRELEKRRRLEEAKLTGAGSTGDSIDDLLS